MSLYKLMVSLGIVLRRSLKLPFKRATALEEEDDEDED